MRVRQAIGGATGVAIGRAIIAILFGGDRPQMLSLVASAMAAAPTAARWSARSRPLVRLAGDLPVRGRRIAAGVRLTDDAAGDAAGPHSKVREVHPPTWRSARVQMVATSATRWSPRRAAGRSCS